MKKFLGIIVIILVLLYAVGSCGSNESSSNENVNVDNSKTHSESISDDSYWLAEMKYVYNYINEYDIDVHKFKEQKKVANTLTESNYNEQWENLVYVKEDPTFSQGTCYVALGDGETSEYVYWGELNKDGYPSGIGVLYYVESFYNYENPDLLYMYMGEFNDGFYDGYGVEFRIPDLYNDYTVYVTTEMFKENIYYFNEPIYEGYFEKGQYRGEGMEIISNYGGVDVNTGEVMLDPNKVDYCLFIGEYKNDVIHGSGMIYDNGILEYEGEFKHGDIVE